MNKLIIVPIDFSKDSINALEHAIYMANKIGGDVRMINVKKGKNLTIPPYFEDFDLIVGNTIEGYFKIIVDKFAEQLDGKLDFKIREGKVNVEITNEAKYNDAYMIVMGTHGVSGFEEFWLGSNAYRVVIEAPCPIITYRNQYNQHEISKIVLPIDISKSSRKKVPFAAELATTFGSEVHVIGVRENINAAAIGKKINSHVKQVVEYFETRKIKTISESLVGDDISNLTINYAKKINANVIISMTEQTENAYNLWLGHHAQQLVNHSPIPVLTIRED